MKKLDENADEFAQEIHYIRTLHLCHTLQCLNVIALYEISNQTIMVPLLCFTFVYLVLFIYTENKLVQDLL